MKAQDSPGPQPSLGLISPLVEDLVIEPNEAFSADKAALAKLAAAEDLFTAAKTVLDPAPLRLSYRYRCDGERTCRGHRQQFIDWEAGESARSWRSEGADGAELTRLMRTKWLEQVCGSDRDTYFFVGNQFMYPRGFLVLGAFWPPAGSRPPSGLFD